jgi:hypothetical protein
MHNAAGGTSQRLNPSWAIVLSLDKKPDIVSPLKYFSEWLYKISESAN